MSVDGDEPITKVDDDTVGRAQSASAFASGLLKLDASSGLVVGVHGAWGSGKTSFVNLARPVLAGQVTAMIDFNPWMFSGSDELVSAFFTEVAAELRLRPDLEAISESLLDYGEAFSGLGWLPVVGPWIERGRGGTKILAKLLERRRGGVSDRRMKLTAALKELDQPLVVVLDDLDRLSTDEIRQIFKLVRLTASFPNLIYIVAFDRARIEAALDEQGIPGSQYLEKILQLTIDLPAIPEQVLLRQIARNLDAALEGIEPLGQFTDDLWSDVLLEVVRPLISTMRDVRRYALAVRVTVDGLDGRIELVDVLGLEAVRVFLRDVFERLHTCAEALTAVDSVSSADARSVARRDAVGALVAAAGERQEVVLALINRLFPAAKKYTGGSTYSPTFATQWLRGRRVASEEILRLYLERVAGSGLSAFLSAERAWELFDDAAALDQYLRALAVEEVEDVIGAIERFECDFRPEQVEAAVPVLINLIPTLPERPRGMFDLDTRLVVGRVTYRLLRSLNDPRRTEATVQAVLPKIETLSGRFELLTTVGYREGAGHKLVSEAAAAVYEHQWRDAVRQAIADGRLTNEWDLALVLYWAARDSEAGESAVLVPADPDVTLAVLRSARSDVRSQSIGSRTIRRSPRLAWDVLTAIYGDEETLNRRIDELLESKAGEDTDLLALAKRYRDGWRPAAFSDDDRYIEAADGPEGGS